MSTTRNNERSSSRYGSIVFQCDEVGCDEECDTGYTTWDYGLAYMRRQGWYVMPDGQGGWDHLCPMHGKARWIAQKRAEEAQNKRDQAQDIRA